MHVRIGCWSVAGAIAGLAITAGIPSTAVASDFLTPVSGSPFSIGGSVDEPLGLAFSNDGLHLVVADGDDGGTGALSSFTVDGEGTLASPAGSPFSTVGSRASDVAVSSTGVVAVVTGSNDVSNYTDSSDGTLTPVGSPLATGNDPDGVVFSPDGSLLAVVDGNGHDLEVFTVSAGGVLAQASSVDAGNAPDGVSFSGNGQLIAVSDSDGNVYTYTVTAGGIATQVGDSNYNAASVAFRPGTSQLAVGDYSPDQVQLFDVAPDGTLTQSSATPMSVNGYPQTISFSPGGGLVAIATGSDVELYSLDADGTATAVPGSPVVPADSGDVGGGTFNHSGTLLAYTSDEFNMGSPEFIDNDVNVVAVTQPMATITSPSQGQTFTESDVVPTAFSCADSASVSISGCTDSAGASSGTGRLDTSQLGTFTYTVTATDAYGQKTQATRTYTVTTPVATTTTTTTPTTTTPATTVPTNTTPTIPSTTTTVAPAVPAPVRVLSIRRQHDGAVVIPVRVSAPGTFYVTATTGSGAERRTFSNRYAVRASRSVNVGPRADAWLRQLANQSGHRMTMTLTVHYTAGGTTRTIIQHKVTITG
jgi:6-phosphogluconolactonase (cycloisomerase 2 family)